LIAWTDSRFATGLAVEMGRSDQRFCRDYYPNQHVFALMTLMAENEGQTIEKTKFPKE
jgi:hypothetical protein